MHDFVHLNYLSKRCREDTEQYQRDKAHESPHCFELFRCAIQDRDERAWELIYKSYRSQVEGWVKYHPEFSACGEEAEHFVGEAFYRIQRAITPEKFDNFPGLSHLLSYLRMCVDRAIIDYLRKSSREASHLSDKELPTNVSQESNALEEQVFTKEFWSCVEKLTNNKAEWLFARGRFVWGYKPRQLCAEFPDIFKDPDDVNRVRVVFLRRLKRNYNEFQECLGENAAIL